MLEEVNNQFKTEHKIYQNMVDYDVYDYSSDEEFSGVLDLALFISSCKISFCSGVC